jgi:ketosteroid isomerase-like protein
LKNYGRNGLTTFTKNALRQQLQLYAPDAAFIQPDGARVKGSAAIRRLYEKVTSTFDSNLNFLSERVEISGDLAYDSGTYTETLVTRTTHKSILSKGSYLTIYRRGKDGNWKIVEQMWAGPLISNQNQ